jgi:ATP-binding cassette subfamily B protein
LQSSLGIVLQEPHLFSGTVARNIAFGRPDATHAEIVAAAGLVEADAFIRGLEQGYDSEVGEGGGRLSVGQRQLVALARAVLADPQVFIMDEATSSVDTETEHHIQRGIEAVLAGRIAVVIAHRLSTVRSADRILVIQDGAIVEQGSHQALLEAKGVYRDLYRRHFAEHSSH